MRFKLSILIILLSVFTFGQVDNKSQLYKEESKNVDRIIKLMSDKCMAYQFSLSWVKKEYEENDPRRVKFEDEVLRKFLKDCKNKDLDDYESKSRLNYKD